MQPRNQDGGLFMSGGSDGGQTRAVVGGGAAAGVRGRCHSNQLPGGAGRVPEGGRACRRHMYT